MSDRDDLLGDAPREATATEALAAEGGRGFDALLARLDEDRERAAEKYLALRRRVVKFFGWRGVRTPEELADETLDRTCRRLAEGHRPLAEDPALYVFGVARNVLREHWERARDPVRAVVAAPEPLHDPETAEQQQAEALRAERRLYCLDKCLQALDPASRELILRYYRHDKQAKIDDRGETARALGIGAAALRLRLYRIRRRLESCVRECLCELEDVGTTRGGDV